MSMLISQETGEGKENSPNRRPLPAALSDVGCVRSLNEDRCTVIKCPSGIAWVICDGMGGNTGGELAAQLAVDAIRRHLEAIPETDLENALTSAIQQANTLILRRRENPIFSEMATTLDAVLFRNDELVLAHIGDSRVYLVRGGDIQLLTTDHTFVQQLVEEGQLQDDEALSHPDAHILTRALGVEPQANLEVKRLWIWEAEDGEDDLLLFVTDGLYSLVPDEELANIAVRHSPEEGCRKLVALAKQRGGFDNITIAIVPLGGKLQSKPDPDRDDAIRGNRERKGRLSERERAPHKAQSRKLKMLLLLGSLILAFSICVWKVFCN